MLNKIIAFNNNIITYDTEQIIKTLLGASVVDFGDLQPFVIEEVKEGLLDLKRAFPWFKVDEIHACDYGDGDVMSAVNVGSGDDMQHLLFINTSFYKQFSTHKEILDHMRDLYLSGEFMSRTIRDDVYHEGGHLLVGIGTTNTEVKFIEKALNAPGITRGLSNYAEKNLSETIAEAMVAIMNNLPIDESVVRLVYQFTGILHNYTRQAI